jgi:hypothetical protein
MNKKLPSVKEYLNGTTKKVQDREVPKEEGCPPIEKKQIRKVRAEKQKKINTNTLVSSQIKVLGLSPPQPIPDTMESNKRFTIRVEYCILPIMNKIYRKSIAFGERGISDYVDTGNIESRLIAKKLRNYDTPLKANYWRLKLLIEPKSIKEGFESEMSKIY